MYYKAVLIDQLINQLKNHIACIKAQSGTVGLDSEEDALRRENAILKQKVELLKNRLCAAETKNGIKQISIPSKGKLVCQNGDITPTPIVNNSESKEEVKQAKQKAKPTTNETKEKKAPTKSAPKPTISEVIDVSRLDMRVGQIVQVERHPDADTLYLEKVNIGSENPITVVSGLVKHVPIEEMQNRVAVFMCNLKPVKMRGIFSEGMIMCASTDDKIEILVPPTDSKPGDRIVVESYPGEPDAQLNPKKKIWEQVKPDLRVDGNGFACYKGAQWNVAGKGPVKSPSVVDAQIS